LDYEVLSTDEPNHAQVQPSNDKVMALPIVLDMNDLRLSTTMRSTAVRTTTKTGSLGSPSFQLPESSSTHTIAENKFLFAGSWNNEDRTIQDDSPVCLANLFGNLPISSAILANHQPHAVQNKQLRSLSIPVWAMLCSNNDLDPGSILPAFTNIRGEIITMLQQGAPWEEVIGEQPNVSALLREDGFRQASLLSRWAISMVYSVKNKGSSLRSLPLRSRKGLPTDLE
jgi:hypothetical protein